MVYVRNIDITGNELYYNKISFYNYLQYKKIEYIHCYFLIDYCLNHNVEIEVLESLEIDNKDDNDYYTRFYECYQYFVINECDIDLLKDINYPLAYIDEMDLYILGVDHLGTSWQDIMTNKSLKDALNSIDYEKIEDLIKC